MATFQSFPIPCSPTTATLYQGTAGSSVTKVFAPRAIIGIGCVSATAGDTLNVRFGNIAGVTATAADWCIPAGTVQFFDLGEEFDRVAIFSASTPKYYAYQFSRT